MGERYFICIQAMVGKHKGGVIVDLRIATRRSKLAQIQADYVGGLLKEKYGIEYKKVLIETTGDKILDVSLDKIGGKGLFVKDIEICMLEGKADGAVHSMKDMPYEVPEGFEIAAMPEREDVRDVFVSKTGLDFYSVPKGARIGTGSSRRARQLKHLRPDIEVVPVRGNIQTRLDKIERENLDGIVLAAAGLARLNLQDVIRNYFDPVDFVPAVGQGALGVETLIESPRAELFKSLESHDVRLCVDGERSFMRRLNGDCHTVVGAYARIEGDTIYMVGLFEIDGRLIKKDITGKPEDNIKLGIKLAEKILNT